MSGSSSKERYKSLLAYIDVLGVFFALLSGLFIVNLTNQETVPKPDGMQMKTEFIIEMTWPDKAFDDVDMHLLLPDGSMVGYNSKDHGYAVLDRDDMGAFGDTITRPDGTTKLIEQNKEVISIRAIVPGRYVVNGRVFREMSSINELQAEVKLPYKATFKLTSVNPRVKEEVSQDVQLTQVGEQITAFSFTVTPEGKITDINTVDQIAFIPSSSFGTDSSPDPEHPGGGDAPPPVQAPPAEPHHVPGQSTI